MSSMILAWKALTLTLAFSPCLSTLRLKTSQTSSIALGANAETDLFTVNIALTREIGKNGKLIETIEGHPTRKMLENSMKVNIIEMPTIEHADGPDLEDFKTLASEDASLSEFDYVVITSPESAKVFSSCVKPSSDLPKIAAVGKATKKALLDEGYTVDFVPSKANGETLAEELPPAKDMGLNNVLYPASAKAAETIQDILGKRKDASFRVQRLNTYDTVSVTLTEDQIALARNDVQIACFGSPTAVDAWLENMDKALGITDLSDEEKQKVAGSNGNSVAVCIGTTTANKCLASGRWESNDIYYPAVDPGMTGWVESCYMAAGDVMERDFWGGGW
eukprot:CAMPEP_0194090972 /NCGR_PEP_ID=MMETSP0149-20130528/41125_1 /TAXON_ID=122233 /ORGANISM="Chaetoceros debilis, Strain MM31A-1" /LENGTH=334 /DNA_ID=CAMNT_0038775407 /DNA_START=56 /DNA_END=1060 /DNA_ORIENTATION=+